MFSKNMKMPYLIDIYGSLLSDRKLEIIELYYNEDYSLSEISELTKISRQGVRDSIKKSEADLLYFESHLHLLEKKDKISLAVSEVSIILQTIRNGAVKDDFCLNESIQKLSDTVSIIQELI